MSQDFDPRRAEPGQRFGYTTAEGRQRELAADGKGVIRPKTAEDVRLLDGFDLPVAHVGTSSKAKKAAKAVPPTPEPVAPEPARDAPAIAETDAAGGSE